MRRLLALVVLFACLIPSFAHAAVVFDAFGNGTEQNISSPYTFSITLGAGTKGVIVRTAYYHNAATLATITGVTVGTTTLSLVSGSDITSGSGIAHAETWGGLTTLAGAQTVTISWTGTDPQIIIADAVSATGVDTTTPINNGAGSSNSSLTALSLSFTSTAGDLTSSLFFGVGATAGAATDQTGRWTSAVTVAAGGDTGPGTTNPTHTWSTTNTFPISDGRGAVMTGANFKASGGGDTTSPSTPTSINASNITSSSADVTWPASSDNVGVSSYDLQRATGTNSFVQIATPTTANTYPDMSLSATTVYTYRVRARDAAGNVSGFATSSSANTINASSRTLAWTAVAPLTQDNFAIYRCVTASATCQPDTTNPYTTTSSTTYIDTNSGNPTSCYQVRALLTGTAGSGLSNLACGTGGPVTLTITTAGTGTGTTSPSATTSYTNGTLVGLTATPNPLSDFSGWSGAADCADGSVTLLTSTICTATFAAQTGNFAYLGNRGVFATRALTNAPALTVATQAQRNNLVIVRAVTDNIATSSGQSSTHLGITDTGGNQYVKLGEQTQTTGTANSGVTVSIWASRPFASLTVGNVLTLALPTATVANTLTLEEYALNASTTFVNSTTTGANGASASPSAVISALSSVARLFIGHLGVESTSAVASFTQSNNYASGTTTNGTVGSATTANVVSFYGSRRLTGTGDTYAPALAIGTSPNWALVFSSLATTVSSNTHPLALATTGTGNGTVTGAGTYYQGSVVKIQALPDASSAFAGWTTTAGSSCTDPTNPTVFVTLNLDTLCVASFTTPNVVNPSRVLTIVTAGTGSGTTSGAGTYADGTVVQLTALPSASSFFGGWTPSACASGSVTLTADTTCTATFTLLPNVTLAITSAGTGLGAVTGAGSYTQGTNATLTATPQVGSLFTGWSGSAGCTGTASPLTLLMDSAKSCTATFDLTSGPGPTGGLVPHPNKKCTASYAVGLTSTVTISNVVWSINGTQTMSQNPGGRMSQTTAPFVFLKSQVPDGSVLSALVTDAAGQQATFATVVTCP